jgi:MFS family permease
LARSETIRVDVKRNLTFIFLINVGVSIVNSGIVPIWPLYLESMGATIMDISLVASIANLADTFLRAFTGLGSDIYGRRRFIILSSILSTVALFLYTVPHEWFYLIPFVALYAASFSFFMPARTAFIADCCPPKDRTRTYSFINIAWPIGSIVGPIIGGVLAEQFGWTYAFYAASGISALTLIPGLMLSEGNTTRTHLGISFSGLRSASPFLAYNFLNGLGMGLTNAIISLYVQLTFNATPTDVGLFFSLGSGLAMLIAQLPGAWIPSRFGRRRTILFCECLLPPLFALWPFAGSYPALLLIYMAINGFWSMTWPSSLSLLMDAADEDRRGAITGFAQTFLMLGFTVGPLMGGLLWDGINPAAPFYASAVVLAATIPVVTKLKSSRISK